MTKLWIIALPILGISNTAFAQDRCADVLQEGTFQTSTYRDNSYFQQIIFSRFLRSTYQSSKTDRAAGFDIPVGEIVLGGNYSEAEYNQKKSELERTYFSQLTATREISVALSSGDETIIGAWQACMAKRGGLSLRFQPLSATQVQVIVQYYSNSSNFDDRLNETAILEGARVTNGAVCFRRGTRIRANVPCRATITMESALKPLNLVLNSREGGADAYLPPRISRVSETKPYPFVRADRLRGSYIRESRKRENTIKLSQSEITEGWHFIQPTARATVEMTYGGGMNKCYRVVNEPNLFTYRYGYSVLAHTRGNDSNWHINCIMHVSITMTRDKWVAQQDNPIETEKTGISGSFTKSIPSDADLDAFPDILNKVPVV